MYYEGNVAICNPTLILRPFGVVGGVIPLGRSIFNISASIEVIKHISMLFITVL
jgi:hypothetical protein